MAAGNDDLHPLLSAIQETIANLREDVQTAYGEIEKVREAITEGVESILDAINDTIQAQAEMKVMEYQMEVRSSRAKLEAKVEQIGDERDELDAKLGRIEERYAERQTELDRTAAERVRNLGEHIYDLRESQFGESIERRLLDAVAPVFADLQEHTDEVGRSRRRRVSGAVKSVSERIQSFTEAQAGLADRIGNHELHPDDIGLDTDRPSTGSELTTFQVPYYVVEFQVDGRTKTATVLPSTVERSSSGQWIDRTVQEINGAEQLLTSANRMQRNATWAEDSVRSADISEAARTLEATTPPHVPRYSNTLEAVLTDRLTVHEDRVFRDSIDEVATAEGGD